ncbi:MAG: hypothetical protein CMO55_18530 [Verrucomicrobiales bacterium]|nr:hypothetical protein [Verrucomicrobiales bacterium]
MGTVQQGKSLFGVIDAVTRQFSFRLQNIPNSPHLLKAEFHRDIEQLQETSRPQRRRDISVVGRIAIRPDQSGMIRPEFAVVGFVHGVRSWRNGEWQRLRIQRKQGASRHHQVSELSITKMSDAD